MSAEELEEFDAKIGMTENPEEVAKQQLREYQANAGIVFDDPDAPVTAPFGSQDEEYR